MGYQPIENYGIIGNMYTTALVGINGSIDWFCFPNHDSPSIFAALLDQEKGGFFQIAPLPNNINHKQLYWPETNILVTRFLTDSGVGEIIDFMPVELSRGQWGYQWLVRLVRVVRCTMKFRMDCYPAFNYARDHHQTKLTETGADFISSALSLALVTGIPLQQDEKGVFAEFILAPGETAVFVLREIDSESNCDGVLQPQEAKKFFQQTISYWRGWISKCNYKGRWREIVERSALVLKLLTYESTGAIVAAPTCGLPEHIGGDRNWDYRYCWIRDSAFTLYALLRIGFTEEAAKFIDWIECRCQELDADGSLQVVYGIDGRHNLEETILDHLQGYRGSYPVRIGNSAYQQLQLDIYGELMDSVYLFNKYGTHISYDLWNNLRQLLEWVCDRWQDKDEGIWETRGEASHFVYSKLMCWVALDRGMRLADKRSFPGNRERWLRVRDQIYEEVMTKGWNREKQAFVQSYGSNSLDASNLTMPLVFF